MKKVGTILLTAGFLFTASLMTFGEETQTELSTEVSEGTEIAAETEEGVASEEITDAASAEDASAADTSAEDASAADTSEAAAPEAAASDSGSVSSSEIVTMIGEPKEVTTSHSAMINGQQIDYTAAAGSMVFSNGGSECEMFYTAYTRDDVEDKSARPITFAYNGGPGAASACVNLLFIGPRTLELDEEGNSVELPAKLVDNEYSLLDLTDLVFIDAVGTGYSRALDGTDPSDFYGYDNDCAVTGNFIWLYLNNSGRWSSPKYLLGESYGTTRSMGVCEYLSGAFSLPLNGLIQVSSVHDADMLQDDSPEDSTYVRFLPTYAADAWYQNQLSQTYQSMEIEDYLSEVRTFADTEYVSALSRGDSLTDEEYDAIAEKISGYTGLDADYVKNQNLRVSMSNFCTELLKDQKLIVGRMDGRITGPVTGGNIGGGDNDPSFKDVIMELGAVTNQHFNDELGYHSDIPYCQISYEANNAWTFPGDSVMGFNQADTIFNNISNNRFLKVWVLCGYYDLATPFHSAEWAYDHLYLNESSKAQVQFTYYKGGHMFYLNNESHAQFHKDAEAWFNG